MRREVQPRGPHLLAIEPPAIDTVAPLAHRAGFHPGRIGAVRGLGQAEGPADTPFQHRLHVARLLLRGAEIAQQQRLHQVADDRALVLQIVVESKPLVREMLADARHREIRAIAPTEFRRQRVTVMAGGVGPATHLLQQCLPLPARQPSVVPVGARFPHASPADFAGARRS